MKSIKVIHWKGKMPDGSEVDDSTLQALSVLLSSKKAEDLPKGLDRFRLFHRLAEAFEKAVKTDVLELDDGDYLFLKSMVENEIPSVWGMNKKISEAIEEFLKGG